MLGKLYFKMKLKTGLASILMIGGVAGFIVAERMEINLENHYWEQVGYMTAVAVGSYKLGAYNAIRRYRNGLKSIWDLPRHSDN